MKDYLRDKKKIKIGIFIENIASQGGLVRSVVNLVNGLSKSDEYDIKIVSCFGESNKKNIYKLNKKIEIKYLETSIYEKKYNKLYKQYKIWNSIYKEIDEEKYEIVISTNAWINIYTSLKKGKAKIIGCEHGAYNHLPEFWRKLTKVIYRKLDRLVLLTNEEREKYSKFSKKISVIGNINTFENAEKAKLEGHKILYVGRIDENKNLESMIRVMGKLKEKDMEFQLQIIGGGEEEDISKIEKLIERTGLINNVILKGFSEKINDDYKSSDIFLLTSKSEGLPMVLLEAASYGIPAIAYDIETGPKTLIEDGISGYVIPKFDENEMANKIVYLLENEKIRKQMGEEAYLKSKLYNEKNIIKLWRQLFDEIKGDKRKN